MFESYKIDLDTISAVNRIHFVLPEDALRIPEALQANILFAEKYASRWGISSHYRVRSYIPANTEVDFYNCFLFNLTDEDLVILKLLDIGLTSYYVEIYVLYKNAAFIEYIKDR